jgi:RimJ/RimL family protein N-acetyltransferase
MSAFDIRLDDGVTLRLRPVDSGDRAGHAALFARLGPESRRRRFMSPKPRLSERELDYFTDVDHVQHEALAAVDPRDGAIVGVGRFVRRSDRPGAAEIALEVADDMQQLGIGTALARWTESRARATGVEVLTATTLRDNRPALALLRRLGFRPAAAGGREVEFELDLAA